MVPCPPTHLLTSRRRAANEAPGQLTCSLAAPTSGCCAAPGLHALRPRPRGNPLKPQPQSSPFLPPPHPHVSNPHHHPSGTTRQHPSSTTQHLRSQQSHSPETIPPPWPTTNMMCAPPRPAAVLTSADLDAPPLVPLQRCLIAPFTARGRSVGCRAAHPC